MKTKIKYSKKYNRDFRIINFYSDEKDKKIDNEKEKFLNFKIKKELNQRKFFSLIKSAVRRALSHKEEKIAFDFSQIEKIEIDNFLAEKKAEALVENILLAAYSFDKYKTKKDGDIKEVLIFGNFSSKIKNIFLEAEKIAEAKNWARDLANTPGGDMTPAILLKEIKKVFKNNKKVKVKALNDAEAKKLGMGLYLSVGQGSDVPSKFIILEYFNGAKKEKPTVLVGKGVTFDTGGLNIKVGPHMLGMNMDMTGGAVVAGALKAVADLNLKKNLVVLIPAVENANSARATRPGDIFKSMSGRTVEVKNTDAEGRLILADAISYAKKYKPKALIDVATLTGAALAALGQRATAVMSTNDKLAQEIRNLGEKSGEYFWPLPLWDEYLENMKSDFADLSNLSNVSWGGTITAGIFLKEFAKEVTDNWAHLDIAPRMESISSDNLAKGATGEPVKTLLELIRNY